MRCRTLLLPIAALLPAFAIAQSAPPAGGASDSWSRPASAASTSYAGDPAHRLAGDGDSHFKFKERRNPAQAPRTNAAQQQSGKAPVGGGMEMGRDGRPTVNCASTPMDPSCH
ncbi:hypothetical protein [Fulvimonas soli]|uniref:Uncharacterized protein n=1 Tax=Fulvimonas soli TaxID=155197 RepID=A0A316I7J3_9GAMM|nr:hypothetical protein [Fulvimonas soli]PWK88715.1 hypothetical protein C7456_105249 [Fulvimonas soli]